VKDTSMSPGLLLLYFGRKSSLQRQAIVVVGMCQKWVNFC